MQVRLYAPAELETQPGRSGQLQRAIYFGRDYLEGRREFDYFAKEVDQGLRFAYCLEKTVGPGPLDGLEVLCWWMAVAMALRGRPH